MRKFFKNLKTIFLHYKWMLAEYDGNMYIVKKYKKEWGIGCGWNEEFLTKDDTRNIELGSVSIILLAKIKSLQKEIEDLKNSPTQIRNEKIDEILR